MVSAAVSEPAAVVSAAAAVVSSVFSVFAARTDQILFIDTGQILSAAVSGYVVFPVLI